MKMDFSNMSLEELMDAQQQLTNAIENKKEEAIADLKEKAEMLGLTKEDLFGTKTRKKAAPVFRHPDDHSLTCGAAGRKPAWFAEAVEKYGEDAVRIENQ
ncbi:H-NS family nucleoid-associated regulatory protein [Neptunicoccus sediminis]|uniref:H-NS histone family protein n=1 Tax=Neptunicoccus sediminis TaxID=1892596 RepID=UPI000845F974|nr:H-NS histone family protein [Neptunicoccus sediminis]